MFNVYYFIKSFDDTYKEDIICLISHMSKEIWRIRQIALGQRIKTTEYEDVSSLFFLYHLTK